MSDVPSYSGGETPLVLPEFDAPPADPRALVEEWFARARELVPEYLAAALATADASGSPSNRMVLLKRVDAQGVVFGTTGTSRKGRELAERPRGAMSLYWRETRQQLRLEGTVRRLGAAESDALWNARPIPSQASAIASRQGEELTDPTGLVVRAAELAASLTPLPRPERWFAYRLEPDVVEFWHETPHRLHRRLEYRLLDGVWEHRRLQP